MLLDIVALTGFMSERKENVCLLWFAKMVSRLW